jgi:hypothetical protein
MVARTAANVAASGQAYTGAINASPCDIGIFVGQGITGVTIDAADISGARYYGVLVNDGNATITNSHIHDTGDSPQGGAQHGIDVAYVSSPNGTTTGSTSYSTLDRYQKGGFVADGQGTTVDIHDSTVTGSGPNPNNAQNGIQYSTHSGGNIYTNTVSLNEYTGTQNAIAIGILLYNIEEPKVDTWNNFYRDDQRNLIVVTSASLGDAPQ